LGQGGWRNEPAKGWAQHSTAAHDRRQVAPTMMDTAGALEDERHPESHNPTCDRAA
jgi:hypothetical protein